MGTPPPGGSRTPHLLVIRHSLIYKSKYFFVQFIYFSRADQSLRHLLHILKQGYIPLLVGGAVQVNYMPKAIRLLCPVMCIYLYITLLDGLQTELDTSEREKAKRMDCATAARSFARLTYYYKDL